MSVIQSVKYLVFRWSVLSELISVRYLIVFAIVYKFSLEKKLKSVYLCAHESWRAQKRPTNDNVLHDEIVDVYTYMNRLMPEVCPHQCFLTRKKTEQALLWACWWNKFEIAVFTGIYKYSEYWTFRIISESIYSNWLVSSWCFKVTGSSYTGTPLMKSEFEATKKISQSFALEFRWNAASS